MEENAVAVRGTPHLLAGVKGVGPNVVLVCWLEGDGGLNKVGEGSANVLLRTQLLFGEGATKHWMWRRGQTKGGRDGFGGMKSGRKQTRTKMRMGPSQ